jgi:glycosyltransferase involved in cell wall biosynthesis
MSHGCVNIASENPPLPEFFGTSALYYPPMDSTILASQVQSVISMGQAERLVMSRSAKNIVLKFSWKICAQRTVDELQKALR